MEQAVWIPVLILAQKLNISHAFVQLMIKQISLNTHVWVNSDFWNIFIFLYKSLKSILL